MFPFIVQLSVLHPFIPPTEYSQINFLVIAPVGCETRARGARTFLLACLAYKVMIIIIRIPGKYNSTRLRGTKSLKALVCLDIFNLAEK